MPILLLDSPPSGGVPSTPTPTGLVGAGWGLGGWGSIEPWGSVAFPAPVIARELGDFSFGCRALSEGYKIEVSFTTPTSLTSPDWSRRLRVLRKRGEWPQSFDDSGASLVLDQSFPGVQTVITVQDDLDAGEIYYYALFALSTDGVWVHDKFTQRCSSYPYDRWGTCDYLYQSLPRGWRSSDTQEHLYQFLCILGAILDDTKTDIEHLLTLFEIDNVHADLLFLLDRTIGWPTWFGAGALQRRKETSEAVDLYKILGRRVSYEQILEEVSNWEVTLIEGWRYVMFSNGRYGSTTPDMTDPDLQRLYGRVDDKLKYTNDTLGWHAVSGLAFFMSEIPGVSGELTQFMLDRARYMIDWGKASYVTTQLIAQPIYEEIWVMTRVVDDYDEIITYTEMTLVPLVEELSWETSSATLFLSLDAGSDTNTLGNRVFHEDLVFL